jgi:drug/metabolite transporter (DMT)-like permease
MSDTVAGIRWLPLVMLVGLGALWGANPSFSKAIVAEGVSPPSIVFWQTLGAGVILLLACTLRGIRVPVDRRALIYYAFIGWICIDLAYMTVIMVVRHIPVGTLAVITVLSPLLTYVFAIVMRLERPQILRVSGILVGLVGVGFLVLPRGSLPSPEAIPWALFALLVPTCFAVGNIFAELGRPKGADGMGLAAGTMLFAAFGGAGIALLNGSFHQAWVAPGYAELLLIGFAVATAVAFLLFQGIVVRAGAVYLGQTGYVVALATIGWGVLFFDETHSKWLWIAAAIVFAGVAMVNFAPRATAPEARSGSTRS